MYNVCMVFSGERPLIVSHQEMTFLQVVSALVYYSAVVTCMFHIFSFLEIIVDFELRITRPI